MVSIWESKLDKGIFLEVQFKENKTKIWHPVCYDNEEDYYKIEDGPRNFKDGSRVQSVQGYKIYYYDDLRWNEIEDEDVFYFLGDKVYSKNYSFDETEEEEDGWKLSELNAIPCREEKIQLALRFEGLEGVPNGNYRFKPLKGSWEKSKASFKTTVKEEDLYGYDVKYHDGDTDTLFVDRNGDIYSDKYSFGKKRQHRLHTHYMVKAHLLHTTILILRIHQQQSRLQNVKIVLLLLRLQKRGSRQVLLLLLLH